MNAHEELSGTEPTVAELMSRGDPRTALLGYLLPPRSALLAEDDLAIQQVLDGADAAFARLQRHAAAITSGSAEGVETIFQDQGCAACGRISSPSDTFKAPCGHNYCADDLSTMYISAILDQSRYPPRCCRRAFELSDTIRSLLDTKVLQDFQDKAEEYETANRVYCVNKDCLRFIKPANISSDCGTCPHCNQQTCAKCKGKYHPDDLACKENEETKAVENIAAEKGWKRCSGCQHMVELVAGCNHMVCRCGHAFCYQCGLRWKTCQCSSVAGRYEYDRNLLDQARIQAQAALRREREPRILPRAGEIDRRDPFMSMVEQIHGPNATVEPRAGALERMRRWNADLAGLFPNNEHWTARREELANAIERVEHTVEARVSVQGPEEPQQ